MVHERHRLALRFEPRDDLLRVHPVFDELQRRALLEITPDPLGQEDDPHPSLTQPLHELPVPHHLPDE